MPTSKHFRIVAILSASLTPIVVTPAIGQQPRATGEISIPVFPSGRRSMELLVIVIRKVHHNGTTGTTPNNCVLRRVLRAVVVHFVSGRIFAAGLRTKIVAWTQRAECLTLGLVSDAFFDELADHSLESRMRADGGGADHVNTE